MRTDYELGFRRKGPPIMSCASRSLLASVVFATAVAYAIDANGWSLTYSAPEIRAKVVDEQTGQPIEGAVVFALWILTTKVGAGNEHMFANVHEFETTTASDGTFIVPAWGPTFHSPNSYLTIFVPQFRIFKPGYFGRRLQNRRYVNPAAPVITSDWNGQALPLQRFDGNWKKYIVSVKSMWTNAPWNCLQTCPRMATAVNEEWERIRPLIPPDLARNELPPAPKPRAPLEQPGDFGRPRK